MMFPFIDLSPAQKLMMMGAMAGAGRVEEGSASGNPLTFQTDLARPLKSLLIPFTPIQSGTGAPSPQNIRTILPWNGLKVFGGGKSLFPFVRTEYEATSNYNGYDTQNTIPDAFIGQKLTYSAYFDNTNSAESSSVKIWGKDKNDSWIWLGSAGNEIGAGAKGTSYKTILIPQNVAWIAFGMIMKVGSKYSQPIVELGETATAYEPYKPITETDISFPSPVYGGTLDVVSGVLTVEWRKIVKTWGEFTNKTSLGDNTRGTFNISSYPSKPSSEAVDAKCNIAPRGTGWSTDSIHFYTNEGSCVVFLPNDTDASTEIEVVYPLTTPQEITLTPEQITVLKGNNTIWSDSDGSMTAVYLKKK